MRTTRKRITRRSTRKGGVRPQPLTNMNRIKRAQNNIQTRKNTKQFLANFTQRHANRMQLKKNANATLKNHVNHGAINGYLKEMYNMRNQTLPVSTLRPNAPSFVVPSKSSLRMNAPAFVPRQ